MFFEAPDLQARDGGAPMDATLKAKFVDLWNKYFAGAELPIIFYYTDYESSAELVPPPFAHRYGSGIMLCI
jgi:hypothetical protein